MKVVTATKTCIQQVMLILAGEVLISDSLLKLVSKLYRIRIKDETDDKKFIPLWVTSIMAQMGTSSVFRAIISREEVLVIKELVLTIIDKYQSELISLDREDYYSSLELLNSLNEFLCVADTIDQVTAEKEDTSSEAPVGEIEFPNQDANAI